MPKLMQSIGAASLFGLSLMMANPQPAQALHTCMYTAQDSAGHSSVYGVGTAIKMSNACDRARRECHRKLDRAFVHGKAGRGATCYRS